jgi:hypothetical protein
VSYGLLADILPLTGQNSFSFVFTRFSSAVITVGRFLPCARFSVEDAGSTFPHFVCVKTNDSLLAFCAVGDDFPGAEVKYILLSTFAPLFIPTISFHALPLLST